MDYFDPAYFDPAYFDTPTAPAAISTGGAASKGQPSRMQIIPQPEPIVDEDWITVI